MFHLFSNHSFINYFSHHWIMNTQKPRFLDKQLIRNLTSHFPTPIYVYSEDILRTQAEQVQDFPCAFGFTPRYAMKANSNRTILRIFREMGIGIDASSEHEVFRAMRAGFTPQEIQLTGQELPKRLKEIVEMGVEFNATSLHQLTEYGKLFPETHASIRVNPGLGSGGTKRTNVGWPASSFGIWHEYLDVAKRIAKEYHLTITKLHTHIGSGADPEIWNKVASMVLDIVRKLPDVTTVSLGGGFKVARIPEEKEANMHEIGLHVKALFEEFAEETGRKLHLEIEPGTFLVANAWNVVTTIQDIVDTGSEGYYFLKVDSGMTELLRPSIYGAQHPIHVIPMNREETEMQDAIVVGHNCESGDIFTPAPGDPETLNPRTLTKAEIGDILIIEWAWAYGAAMSTHGYNSFPEAGEVLLRSDGTLLEIRGRAKEEEVWRNESDVSL